MALAASAGLDFENAAGGNDIGVSMVSHDDGRSSIGGGVEGFDNAS
jgi:hypothetical protein